MACPNPFKPSDCANITQQLQTIHDTLELAAKCKACGLDVDGYIQENQNIAATLSAIKKEFFPNEN